MNGHANDGWETVTAPGGKAAKKTGNGKAKKAKAAAFKGPRLEDVLPHDQLNVLGVSARPEPVPSPKKEKAKPKPAPKKAHPTKPTREAPPKTVEEAVKKIDNADLQNVLATAKAHYPTNGMLRIKDAASYLNLTLNASTPVDLSNPFSSHPLCLLTKETKRLLAALYEECGDQARESAFDNLTANMAHDMAKDLCPNGYLVVLQSLAEVYPSLCTNNGRRVAELLKSYQNRSNVGTALAWVIGQGGRKDLGIGFKVWIEFISELLPLKSYSRFVTDYLCGLLEQHKNRIKSNKVRVLFSAPFLKLFDVIFASLQMPNVNKQYSARLVELYPTIKSISIGDCSQDHDLFPEFLRRLDKSGENEAALRQELLSCLSQSLRRNDASLKHWQNMYTSYLSASALVLENLDENWKSVQSELRRKPAFGDSLRAFKEYNDSVTSQKDGLEEASSAVESLVFKMSQRSSSGGWFPWKTAILLLAVAIWYLVSEDIKLHKGFKSSKTGLFLKDVGLDQHALTAYDASTKAYADGRAWTEKNLPVAQAKAQEWAKQARPLWNKFLQLLADAYAWTANFVVLCVQKLEASFPGAQEKLHVLYHDALEFLAWAFERFCHFAVLFAQAVVEWAKVAAAVLKENFDRVAKSDDKVNESMVVAQNAYKWTSLRAAELVQWISAMAK